jgi:flagellar basal-body rod protein FlgC
MNAILSIASSGMTAGMRRLEVSASTFDPSAPFADANGMVASPNVNLANEAVQQLISRYTFVMNAVVVRTYEQMMKSLLDIKT